MMPFCPSCRVTYGRKFQTGDPCPACRAILTMTPRKIALAPNTSVRLDRQTTTGKDTRDVQAFPFDNASLRDRDEGGKASSDQGWVSMDGIAPVIVRAGQSSRIINENLNELLPRSMELVNVAIKDVKGKP